MSDHQVKSITVKLEDIIFPSNTFKLKMQVNNFLITECRKVVIPDDGGLRIIKQI